MARRVAIVGAALSDCGRVDDKSPFELHYQAASRALADAGLERADVDGFSSCGTGLLAPIEVAEYLFAVAFVIALVWLIVDDLGSPLWGGLTSIRLR